MNKHISVVYKDLEGAKKHEVGFNSYEEYKTWCSTMYNRVTVVSVVGVM